MKNYQSVLSQRTLSLIPRIKAPFAAAIFAWQSSPRRHDNHRDNVSREENISSTSMKPSPIANLAKFVNPGNLNRCSYVEAMATKSFTTCPQQLPRRKEPETDCESSTARSARLLEPHARFNFIIRRLTTTTEYSFTRTTMSPDHSSLTASLSFGARRCTV